MNEQVSGASMAVALAEVCGLAIVYSDALFDAFDEAEYRRLMGDAAIDDAAFAQCVAVAAAAVQEAQ